MKVRFLIVLVGLVVAVGVAGLLVPSQSAEAQRAPKSNAEVELIVSLGTSPDGEPATLRSVVSNIGSSGEDGIRKPGDFTVDSFFDIYIVSNIGSSGEDGVSADLTVSNIGSSGQDGVRKSTATFDSFFDISYDIGGRNVEIELVALQLRATISDPSDTAGLLDAVTKAAADAGGGVYYGHVRTGDGHVTILK